MENDQEIEGKHRQIANSNPWTKNMVSDPDAPELYSPRAIWGFSAFFTVIFGAVLLAINVTDRKAKWLVIGFGILYTSVALVILAQISHPNSGITIGINGAGGLILTTFFWDKYIGKETPFRSKAIWKALIISILISIPFLLAMIYG